MKDSGLEVGTERYAEEYDRYFWDELYKVYDDADFLTRTASVKLYDGDLQLDEYSNVEFEAALFGLNKDDYQFFKQEFLESE